MLFSEIVLYKIETRDCIPISTVHQKLSYFHISDIFSCEIYFKVQEVSGKERSIDLICQQGISCRSQNKIDSFRIITLWE